MRRWLLEVGLLAPRGGRDRYEHRRGEPRGFALIWTAFLVIGTMACFAAYGIGRGISPQGYANAARSLTSVLGLGISVLWPLVRLSQFPARGGGGSVVTRDLVIVLLPLQAVLWPQALVARWPVEVIAAVASCLGAWAAIVGALLAVALGGPDHRRDETGNRLDESRGRRVGPRWVVMLLLVVLVLAGPVYWWLGPIVSGGDLPVSASFWSRMASPLTAPLELTRPAHWTGRAATVEDQHWRAIGFTLVVSGALWVIAAGFARGPAKR